MKTELIEKTEDKFRLEIEITKEEALTLSDRDMKRLLKDIKKLCETDKMLEKIRQMEALKKAKENAEREPFIAKNYINVEIENKAGSKDIVTDRLIDKIIEGNSFFIPEELEDEIEFVYKGTLQSMKYQRLFGDGSLENQEEDPSEIRKNVEAEVTREYKENILLKSIIEQENITCSFEELETEAKAIAERDDCTLEFVRKFMGDDYGMLKKDMLKKKAREFIYNNANL